MGKWAGIVGFNEKCRLQGMLEEDVGIYPGKKGRYVEREIVASDGLKHAKKTILDRVVDGDSDA